MVLHFPRILIFIFFIYLFIYFLFHHSGRADLKLPAFETRVQLHFRFIVLSFHLVLF